MRMSDLNVAKLSATLKLEMRNQPKKHTEGISESSDSCGDKVRLQYAALVPPFFTHTWVARHSDKIALLIDNLERMPLILCAWFLELAVASWFRTTAGLKKTVNMRIRDDVECLALVVVICRLFRFHIKHIKELGDLP